MTHRRNSGASRGYRAAALRDVGREEVALLRAAHRGLAGELRSIRARSEQQIHAARNSLTAVWAAADVLARHLDQLPEDERSSLATTICSEISHLRNLLDRAGPEPAPFRVAEAVLPRVLAARAAGLEVRSALGLDAYAHGRRVEVGDVVELLLENVLRHAPGSPAWVDVHADVDVDVVEVRVRDVGPGVPVARRADLFERVRRPGALRTAADLAAARCLLRDQGGDLTVDDTVATGACFTVTLRRVPAPVIDLRDGGALAARAR